MAWSIFQIDELDNYKLQRIHVHIDDIDDNTFPVKSMGLIPRDPTESLLLCICLFSIGNLTLPDNCY